MVAPTTASHVEHVQGKDRVQDAAPPTAGSCTTATVGWGGAELLVAEAACSIPARATHGNCAAWFIISRARYRGRGRTLDSVPSLVTASPCVFSKCCS